MAAPKKLPPWLAKSEKGETKKSEKKESSKFEKKEKNLGADKPKPFMCGGKVKGK